MRDERMMPTILEGARVQSSLCRPCAGPAGCAAAASPLLCGCAPAVQPPAHIAGAAPAWRLCAAPTARLRSAARQLKSGTRTRQHRRGCLAHPQQYVQASRGALLYCCSTRPSWLSGASQPRSQCLSPAIGGGLARAAAAVTVRNACFPGRGLLVTACGDSLVPAAQAGLLSWGQCLWCQVTQGCIKAIACMPGRGRAAAHTPAQSAQQLCERVLSAAGPPGRAACGLPAPVQLLPPASAQPPHLSAAAAPAAASETPP